MRAKLTLFAVLIVSLFGFNAQAQSIYALEGGGANLVRFTVADPSTTTSVPITGVSLLGPLVSIDFRPATGELYGMGYNNTLTEIQLYTIDTVTGVATAVGDPDTLNLVIGGNTAFDFNPSVDRIRVITTVDSNYRLNPVTGQVSAIDGIISYAAGDVNAGSTPRVRSVAYINNYDSAATTLLYAYDLDADVLVTINPANSGLMQTVGASGKDLDVIDMDISADNMAYIVGHGLGGPDSLYTLNLTTGAVAGVRYIGTGLALQDIAVWISGAAPVGIRNLANEIEVAIYPNPTNDKVFVNMGTATNGTMVKVMDVSGKQVYGQAMESGSATLTIDLGGYAPGMYYISVENATGRTVKSVGKY